MPPALCAMPTPGAYVYRQLSLYQTMRQYGGWRYKPHPGQRGR